MRLVRFSALGNSLHSFERLPSGVSVENVVLTAEDGGESQGVLYTGGEARTVVCFMHPRGDQSRHWAMPALLEAGFAVFGHAGRYLLNDADFVYESILADVAAASLWLRDRGFSRVVAVGNSGGGTLFSFYQSQAVRAPTLRFSATPAGEPCALPRLTMPPLDGIVHLATHLGQGKLMLDNIDPSVVDEHDPLSCDRALDMYDPDNGYRTPPEPSRYDEAFLSRYREAQAARVRRIDAIAHAMLEEARQHRACLESESASALSRRERALLERRAFAGRYLLVHRTQANPALLDPDITPNLRELGSFYSERPDICNYLALGFGKFQTPRAWLSTWSYFASRASTLSCLPDIHVPTLVVAFTGDNMIFPGELELIYERSVASDKQLIYVDGDHFGNPGGREQACNAMVAFLSTRY